MLGEKLDELEDAIRRVNNADKQRAGWIQHALEELEELRSDVIGELGHNAADSYLKTTFIGYIDNARHLLKRALVA